MICLPIRLSLRAALLGVALFSLASAPAKPLRVLTYNVLYGFNHGKTREIGAEWIAAQKPDVLALQELNGFKQESLASMAKQWGHDHAVLLKEQGFPVGLTANSEITVIEKRLDGMWHGYLHAKVRGIHFFVVHFSPSRHDFRMKEARLLTEKIKPLLGEGEAVLVLGDFNCNSPLDHEWLKARPADAKEQKALDEKTRQRRAANVDPNSAVMAQFLELGLIDLVHAKQTARERARGTFATRLLPKYRSDAQRKNKTWRIDFLLASPALAKQCISARIPRDEEADLISDHYPVEAVLENLERSRTAPSKTEDFSDD